MAVDGTAGSAAAGEPETPYALGIDLGASSVKLVAVAIGGDRGGDAGAGAPVPALSAPTACRVLWSERAPHGGDPLGALRGALLRLERALPPGRCACWQATGSGAAALRDYDPQAPVLGDVPAVVLGAQALVPQAASVMEIGAQNALFATGIAPGRVPRFSMNEGCASGTGAFFENQTGRLGLKIEDYSGLVAQAASVPRLSGRCAVFAKTDIIHRQQEGVPSADILLGLCYAMARSYKSAIVRDLPVERPVALAGGVLLNDGVVRAVREVFKLGEDELLCGRQNLFLGAAGAALDAARRLAGADGAPQGLGLAELTEALGTRAGSEPLPRREPLPDVGDFEPGKGFTLLPPEEWRPGADGLVECALGVDVGSTSTNLVLVDREGRLIDAQYLRTAGDPKRAVREGLASLGERLGGRVRVAAAATTGSGRTMVGDYIGADLVRDEITAQARAAVAADPDADTVFEIGGQDSKFIALRGGQVSDFRMNKICAAGTGSFVEEQAARLDIPLDEYGAVALSAKSPVDLGERCTVFMETAAGSALARGADKADVAAGICQSVVTNYLNRVVDARLVGGRIVLQGGVNYNKGIVAAFRQRFGGRVTVSPWFAVSGAVGAALLALDALGQGGAAGDGGAPQPSAFKGFDLSGGAARAASARDARAAESLAFFERNTELMLKDCDPSRDPAKKTVGVPRSLTMYRLFPLANAFFHKLGYNVAISDESDEDVVRLAQQTAQGETCYPVKLMHGHMEQLARRGVDYIFMPSMHTIRHEHTGIAHNYACPYMQAAPALIARELHLEERGVRLLNPLLDMDFGQKAMATAMLGVGAELGHSERETSLAILAGGMAVREFNRASEEMGAELLAGLGADERVLVIVTRPYGIFDEALNMQIPQALAERGERVITMENLTGQDDGMAEIYPNLYWPFGQHIVGTARLIRRDPRLFAVYLTAHGCGPDTMIAHLFASEMGDKPYLQVEVDEHYSKVGVVTRIEAFLNSIDNYTRSQAERSAREAGPLVLGEGPAGGEKPAAADGGPGQGSPDGGPGQGSSDGGPRWALRPGNSFALDPTRPVLVPGWGPYGRAVAGWLRGRGFGDVRVMEPDAGAVALGRSMTDSKEYLSFVATLGMAMRAAGMGGGDGADGDGLWQERPGAVPGAQVVVPSSEGAEADGQYDRVAWAALRDAGRLQGPGALEVAAPVLERVPLDCPDAEGLFEAVLAGDAELARAASARAGEAPRGSILVAGEWQCVFGDALAGGLWDRVARAGWQVRRMPLAEYLWFLWEDALEERARALPADDPSAAACRGLLDRLAARMAQASRDLGADSPYSPDPAALRAEADALCGRFRAGNGRYRMAKACNPGAGVRGVVEVASAYENADVVLRLKEDGLAPAAPGEEPGPGPAASGPRVPVLHLSLDANLDQGIDERVASFLYYL